jgi:hypothetical protein
MLEIYLVGKNNFLPLLNLNITHLSQENCRSFYIIIIIIIIRCLCLSTCQQQVAYNNNNLNNNNYNNNKHVCTVARESGSGDSKLICQLE